MVAYARASSTQYEYVGNILSTSRGKEKYDNLLALAGRYDIIT